MKVPSEPLTALTQVIQCLSQDDIVIRPADEGWKVFCLDPSHTMMANFIINKDQFDEAEYDDEENRITFAVNRTALSNALKVVSGDTVDLKLDNGKIIISGGGSKVSFALTEFDPNTPIPTPKFQTTVDVEIDSEDLKGILKGAALFKGIEHIIFEATEEGLTISGGSEHGAEVSSTINQDDCGAFDGVGKTKLALAAILGITATIPKGAIVDVKFGTDLPIILSWGGPGWNLKWTAAPLVDRED